MIYFIQDESVLNIKIGFTGADDALERMKTLQTGSPSGLVLLFTMPGKKEDERKLHDRFASARVHGEWFRPTPDLVQFIISMQAAKASGQVKADVSKHWPPFLSEEHLWGAGPLHEFQTGPTFSVICPVCGFEYVHHDSEPQDVLLAQGSIEAASLSFTCENGHCWSLAFGFRKGFMNLVVINDLALEDERKGYAQETADEEAGEWVEQFYSLDGKKL